MKDKGKQKEKAIRILKTGDEYDILKGFEINTSFPNKNFELKMTPKGRIYFKELPDYKSPKKIYSNDKDFMDHVKRTWNSMESGNLGVALVGGKGLGKSLTANELAHSLGVPVLRIKEPVLSMAQLEIINSIDSDCVLFLDEFEKIVKDTDNTDFVKQEELLSFLDGGGTKNNKVMFIITANRSHHISEYLKNRPSRIRYYKEYKQMSDSLIIEIVDDLLKNTNHKEDLISNLEYTNLNIDVLIAVIKEINIHDKPYSTFKQFFNYKEEGESVCKTFIEYEGQTHELSEVKGTAYDGTTIGKIKIAEKSGSQNNAARFRQISFDEDVYVTDQPKEAEGIARWYDDVEKDYKSERVIIKLVPITRTLTNAYI